MADNTHIEWTDATWNPVTGCSVTSPGCTNCYAMKLAGTRLAHHPSRKGLTTDTKAGPVWTGEVRLNEDWLTQPLKWKRPRRIFVCAHGDLFHENVPDEWIDRVFAVMALAPQHTFQVLTKRADRMRAYCQSRNSGGTSAIVAANALDNANWLSRELAVKSEPQFQNIWPLPNVWLGVSVEDQARADERVPDLLATPAAVRFISAEPLVGPVDLTWIAEPDEDKDGVIDALLGCNWVERPGDDYRPTRPAHEGRCMGRWVVSGSDDIIANRKIDWVIAGGESGPGARPSHPGWFRALRDQCAAAGVPFHFKQWGRWTPVCEMAEQLLDDIYHPAPISSPDASRRCKVGQCVLHADSTRFDGEAMFRRPAFEQGSGAMTMFSVGKKRAGRLLDGREWNEVPA